MSRKSIEVAGFSHGGLPIPAASRIGPLLVTGGIHGLDLEAGEHGDAEDQTKRMFANLRNILEAGGAGFDAVVRMTIYVKSPDARQAINAEWLKAFPDEKSRPARHTLTYEYLPGPMIVQCDALAYLEVSNL